MGVRAAALVLALAIPAAACTSGGDADPPPPGVVPSGSPDPGASAFGWRSVSATRAGFDPARLRAVTREAGRQASSCFVVVRAGRLVVERYWRDGSATTPAPVFSVTKSVTSTLVGLAQDDGDLDIDDSASRFVPQWQGTAASAPTIRNLLSNDSGRAWSPATDYVGLIGAEDRTAYAVELAQTDPPGTVWAYNNAAIQTLDRVLRNATGSDPATLAADRLFGPLGMEETRMTGDASGRSTNLAFGMESTCLDLARFGQLFVQHGRWHGERLVSASWVREAVGSASQELNAGYGLLWWVNRWGPLRGPLDQADPAGPPGVIRVGRIVPDGPPDMYAAQGFGGQTVLVDPGSRTVVVRLGDPVVDGVRSTYSFADAARVVTYASE